VTQRHFEIYKENTSEELSDYDLNEIVNPLVKKIFYWYKSEPYEGSGTMLLLMESNSIIFHDLSHCSCFRPIERLDYDKNIYWNINDAISEQAIKDDKNDYYGINKVFALFKVVMNI
jgi:hypothetical protein